MMNSQALRYLISQCHVFVASRFHAMVSSLATVVPTLVIGWSHKYREVLDMFGQADLAVAHQDCTEARFRDMLTGLLDQREQVAGEIARALPAVRAKALEQVKVIEDVARR